MLQDKLPAIAAGALTIGIIAAAGWFLAMPEPPPPPAMENGEPWRGAKALAGTWRLAREDAYQENDCKGVDRSDYELVLDRIRPSGLSGRMTMKFTRQAGQLAAGGTCGGRARSGDYDVMVAKDSFGQLEMTMTARACDDGGTRCPLVDHKGHIRQEKGALVFGRDRLVKVVGR